MLLTVCCQLHKRHSPANLFFLTWFFVIYLIDILLLSSRIFHLHDNGQHKISRKLGSAQGIPIRKHWWETTGSSRLLDSHLKTKTCKTLNKVLKKWLSPWCLYFRWMNQQTKGSLDRLSDKLLSEQNPCKHWFCEGTGNVWMNKDARWYFIFIYFTL